MTHTRYGRSHLNLNGQLTNTSRSDGAPEPDGSIKAVARKKILHYRQVYVDHPDPIAFMPVAVDTSGRIYDDFLRLLFLHAHRESSALANDIPEESDHFPFLRSADLEKGHHRGLYAGKSAEIDVCGDIHAVRGVDGRRSTAERCCSVAPVEAAGDTRGFDCVGFDCVGFDGVWGRATYGRHRVSFTLGDLQHSLPCALCFVFIMNR
jgi:hypothetical protein